MFSLIITLISIALVAALALATLYYGGSAFERGAASASATKIHSQAQQLRGAAELYRADTGGYPLTLELLVTGNYLKSIPVALAPITGPAAPTLLSESLAAGSTWRMVTPGLPVFSVAPVDMATCESINKKAYGISGILKSVRLAYTTQCFGTSLANLKVVTTKSADSLAQASGSPLASVSLLPVLSDPVPGVSSLDSSPAGWFVVAQASLAAPNFSLSPANVDFGLSVRGQDSVQTVTVVNNGSAPLLSPVIVSEGAAYQAGHNCPASLAVGASCAVTVTFNPALIQAYTGSAALSFEGLSALTVPLSGTAYNPVVLAPTTLPAAIKNAAYAPVSFDSLFSATNETTPDLGQVEWSAGAGLPTGMTLTADGILSGTPTQATTGASFQVTATYKLNSGQQAYTIVVDGGELQVTQVAAGRDHTCAITIAGGVKCWGRDAQGQLGNDTALTNQSTPVNVEGLTSGVASVTAGGYHTCAVTIAGGVKCWGLNDKGQLGNNTTLTHSPTPVNVVGLTSGGASLSAGHEHTCAVTTAGGLKCWGFDGNGQLGNDPALALQRTPVNVTGLTVGVASVAAGWHHTCATTTAGGVKCWGAGYQGQVGNETVTTYSTTPVDVLGLTAGVASVSAGGYHTCAVTIAGGVKCWGLNGEGQIGDNSPPTNRLTPVDVPGLASGTASVSAGGFHTCAVTIAGGLKCWGWHKAGAGVDAWSYIPKDIAGFTAGVTSVGSGVSHACATTAGGLKCWGLDTYGQLSNGSVRVAY